MTVETNIIGVYKVRGRTDVHLIELDIKANHTEIDISAFTQEQHGIAWLNWQSPWDEKYLNNEGTQIIGGWQYSHQDKSAQTRLAFYFHFLSFDKPLKTPFGDVDLKQAEPMPKRLLEIMKYIQPD